MPMISTRSMQLPEEIGMYVDSLRKAYPTIDQVWLLGPEVNASETLSAKWDLLVFADQNVLDAVRSDREWHRDDVMLRIVVDGDRYESAWGEPQPGRLDDVGWQLEDLHSATYGRPVAGRDDERLSAARVR